MRFVTADQSNTDNYKLMTGLVVPRPIGWIGSWSASDGDSTDRRSERVANLAPYSFFNAVSGNPPTIIVSAGVRPGRKDTHANLEDSGEFTVNIVSEALGEAMNNSAAELGVGESEFDLTELTAVPATIVDAPMVAQAPAVLECRVVNRVEIGPDDGPTSNVVFFGRVEVIHVDDQILDGTRIRHDLLKPLGRLAGNGYSTVADSMFDLIRPDR